MLRRPPRSTPYPAPFPYTALFRSFADRGWFFAAIAHDVAERRQELGYSQRELAELVGTTQSAIARLERGGRPPRIDTLLRIADALDCDLAVELRPRKGG